jgi:hypothetical protein
VRFASWQTWTEKSFITQTLLTRYILPTTTNPREGTFSPWLTIRHSTRLLIATNEDILAIEATGNDGIVVAAYLAN